MNGPLVLNSSALLAQLAICVYAVESGAGHAVTVLALVVLAFEAFVLGVILSERIP